MGVSDTHVCVGECHFELIQLGKLRGHGGGVVKPGLCNLDPEVEYGGAAGSTTVCGFQLGPLSLERGVVDFGFDQGVYVLLDI